MSIPSALNEARAILSANNFSIDDLPKDLNAFGWKVMMEQLSLSPGQLCALQNLVTNNSKATKRTGSVKKPRKGVVKEEVIDLGGGDSDEKECEEVVSISPSKPSAKSASSPIATITKSGINIISYIYNFIILITPLLM